MQSSNIDGVTGALMLLEGSLNLLNRIHEKYLQTGQNKLFNIYYLQFFA
jgi:hypothetical protein